VLHVREAVVYDFAEHVLVCVVQNYVPYAVPDVSAGLGAEEVLVAHDELSPVAAPQDGVSRARGKVREDVLVQHSLVSLAEIDAVGERLYF
jgi:hypothetical protein